MLAAATGAFSFRCQPLSAGDRRCHRYLAISRGRLARRYSAFREHSDTPPGFLSIYFDMPAVPTEFPPAFYARRFRLFFPTVRAMPVHASPLATLFLQAFTLHFWRSSVMDILLFLRHTTSGAIFQGDFRDELHLWRPRLTTLIQARTGRDHLSRIVR